MDIKDLQALCERMNMVRQQIDDIKEDKKKLEAELATMKKEAVEHLDAHGLKNFDHGQGKISINERKSVSIQDKHVLFNWLKEQNIFEDMVTISAPTANKLYKEELEKATEAGDVDFLTQGIPGLSSPNTFRDIRFLKG